MYVCLNCFVVSSTTSAVTTNLKKESSLESWLSTYKPKELQANLNKLATKLDDDSGY